MAPAASASVMPATRIVVPAGAAPSIVCAKNAVAPAIAPSHDAGTINIVSARHDRADVGVTEQARHEEDRERGSEARDPAPRERPGPCDNR